MVYKKLLKDWFGAEQDSVPFLFVLKIFLW